MGETTHEGVDLRRYLRTAWRWKWLLLAIVTLIPATVYVISSSLEKTYEAKTTLFVQATTVASPEFSQQTSVSTSSPATVARLVQTPVVADLAAKALDEPRQGRALLPYVSAALDENIGSGSDNNFLTITARSNDPQRAADVAEAFGQAVAQKRSQEVERSIDRTLRELGSERDAIAELGQAAKLELADQIAKLRTLRGTQGGATQIVDPVQVPSSPVSPEPVRNTALAFIFSALLAIGLLPVLDRLDRKLRDPEELEDLVGAPLLAMVPDGAFPGRLPTPQVREAFQTLRAGLTYFNVDHPLNTIMVTSPGHGEGKTTVATNMAVALAQDGRDVIVVDADLRRPQVADRLGVEASVGLDAVLLGERTVEDAMVDVPAIQGGRLRVLPTVTPPPNPAILLSSERMRNLLAELAGTSDVIVIDTPPLLVVSDAMGLVKESDGVVLVARADYTTRDALVRTRDVIATASGKILGVVATATKASGLYGYDLYGYDDVEHTDVMPAMTNGQPNGGLIGRVRRGASTKSDAGKDEV